MDMQKNIKVALISPQKGSYSETFISSQKDLLPFKVYYYYNGAIPSMLEGSGNIMKGNSLGKFVFKLKKRTSYQGNAWAQNSFLRSLRKNNIDIVLAQYGPTGEAVLSVCIKLGLPLIVHFHGYDASMYDILGKYENYKNIFNKATAIIAVSRAMEKKLIDIGCPRSKLIYNAYGPNDSFFDINPSFSNLTFIGVGRFTDKKAPYYTILAFAKVLKKYPSSRLIIAGDGILLNTCKNLIRYLGIERAVELPGVITPEEFRNYLKSSIAFVQHSIIAESGDSEGTPVAILEASAAGLPVISTKHAGIPDVIIDGVTGLLVEEHDVDGMSKAMMKVLKNKQLGQKLGSAGRKIIRQQHSMKHYIDRLSNAIEDAYFNNKTN